MTKYVLFSPLGMTDPTRGFRDGGFIHICRFYKPYKVYLYMSKEICEKDKSGIYDYCLGKLCEKLNFSCDVEKIKRPELSDVYRFDIFFDDFIAAIRNISAENPNSTILLNLSSGTPAMKAALLIIAGLIEHKFLPIQVPTPEKEANKEKTVGFDYDVHSEWELNEDNGDKLINRCEIAETRNFNAMIKREVILKHIESFDYNAAKTIAKTIPEQLSPEAMNLIVAASYRYSFDLHKAKIHSDIAGYKMFPIENILQRKIFEYVLLLQIKQQRAEYADFIRGITPVMTDLFEECLKNICNISISLYCEEKKNKSGSIVLELKSSKLPLELLKMLNKGFGGEYKDCPLSSTTMRFLIEGACKDSEVVKLVSNLRDVEEAARNLVAHEIESVTEDWLKKKTGFTSIQIIKMLKSLTSKVYEGVTDSSWTSYDQMNKKIKELLQ